MMMNKAIRKVVVMSILLVGLMTYAENGDPKPAMEVKSINTESFLLSVKEVKSRTSIQIKDIYGELIYTEKMEVGKRYRKIYDISSLPVGTYYLKIVDKEYSKIYSLVKNDDTLVVNIDFSSARIDANMLATLMN
jgi:hypothetical protein